MESEIEEMDRISQLPESIVHHILSFFDATFPEEPVRMSVLSKTWFHLTASFPVLEFWRYTFNEYQSQSRESFFKYVEYTTSRFCHQNFPAHKFELITTLEEHAELDIVNRCLERLLKNGVRELVIDINSSESPSASDMPKYQFPNTLLSVSMLKSLTICGCDLPSSLMADAVKFKSLTQLCLVEVPIDDEVIKHLTTSCPLLQDVNIRGCHGFKKFGIYGHQNLQKLSVCYVNPVERIDIEAPNLSDLFIADWHESGAPQMNLASCKKLTTVIYNGHPLPNLNAFTNFLSNFPFIQNLILINKYKYKLSSLSLRTLALYSDIDLDDVEFSTPNLVLFIYACNFHFYGPVVGADLWPLLRDSTHLKACMQCYPDGDIHALWFQKLRRFLDKKTGLKVLNLYIHSADTQKFIELEKLKAIESPPYELEHVELHLDHHEESTDHAAFVDAVLWCCRPRSLSLRSSVPLTDIEEHSDVVKFTYQKLLEQEDEGHTKIQIVSPSSSQAQKKFMDLKSSSMALPREGKTLSKDMWIWRRYDALDLGVLFVTKKVLKLLVKIRVYSKASETDKSTYE